MDGYIVLSEVQVLRHEVEDALRVEEQSLNEIIRSELMPNNVLVERTHEVIPL